MVLKDDRQRVKDLLRETVTMLCKRGLSYNAQLSVEGLLGITLDDDEVFLVNIKETVQNPTSSSPLTTSEQDLEDSMSLSTGDSPLGGESRADIVSRAVTPMHTFRNSSIRGKQRSRKRVWGMETRVSQGDQAKGSSETRRSSDSSPNSAEPPRKQQLADDAASLPHSVVKQEIAESGEHGDCQESQNFDNSFASSVFNVDQPTELSPTGNDDAVQSARCRLPVAIAVEGNQSEEQPPSDVQPGCSSWTESADKMPGPKSHMELESTLLSDQEGLDPTFIEKVRFMILKESGCYVTPRMLCRRYSSFLRVHNVVAAMKAITNAVDDVSHIGIYAALNERTKVFYKCPPHLIKLSILEQHGYSWSDYNCNYYITPKGNKDQSTSTYVTFVTHILDNNPYGTISLMDLHDSVDTSLITVTDPNSQMELQSAVVHSEGCFASCRQILRRVRKTYQAAHVLWAMQSLSSPEDHSLHFGTYVQALGRSKLFYKCPPALIKPEALDLYGLTVEQYTNLYSKHPLSQCGAANWEQYVLQALKHFPYDMQYFPFHSVGVSEEFQERLKQEAVNTQKTSRSTVTTVSATLAQKPEEDNQSESSLVQTNNPENADTINVSAGLAEEI